MDARTAELPVISQQQSWLQRERASGRFYDRLALGHRGRFWSAMMALSVWLLRRGAEPGTLLSPPLIALLLIANLLPAIALMALYARKVAVRRAEQGGLGSGRLHVRLVALFSVIAAVPTVLVAIFASLLFQSGLEFWFSNRARNMLENTVQVAQSDLRARSGPGGDRDADDERRRRRTILKQVPIDDPRFAEAFAKLQVYHRRLSEAIIFTVWAARARSGRWLWSIRTIGRSIRSSRREGCQARPTPECVVDANSPDRVRCLTRLDYGPEYLSLRSAAYSIPQFREQLERANDVLERLSGAAREVAGEPAASSMPRCCSAR